MPEFISNIMLITCIHFLILLFLLLLCVVVQWLTCLTANQEVRVQLLAKTEIWLEISAPSAPLPNSAMMSTLTVHCQCEDKAARERTLPSYAVAEKMKSLTLASLRGCSSSSYYYYVAIIIIIFIIIIICVSLII